MHVLLGERKIGLAQTRFMLNTRMAQHYTRSNRWQRIANPYPNPSRHVFFCFFLHWCTPQVLVCSPACGTVETGWLHLIMSIVELGISVRKMGWTLFKCTESRFVFRTPRILAVRVVSRPGSGTARELVWLFDFAFSLFSFDSFTDASQVFLPSLLLLICCVNWVAGVPDMLETTDNLTWSNSLQPPELLYHSYTSQANCCI